MEPRKLPPKLSCYRWTHVIPTPGIKIVGWLMNHPFSCVTHYYHATKACADEMSKGVVPCRWCRIGEKKGETGYTAIQTVSGDRNVVSLNAEESRKVEQFALHSRVEVFRSKAYKSPVKMRLASDQSSECPDYIVKQPPVNLEAFLIKLWALPELTCWWEETGQKVIAEAEPISVAPPQEAEEPKKPKKRTIDPEEIKRLLRERGGVVKPSESILDQFVRDIGVADDPSKNGHAKKPK